MTTLKVTRVGMLGISTENEHERKDITDLPARVLVPSTNRLSPSLTKRLPSRHS